MKCVIEHGKDLSQAEIERRVEACDLVQVIHHDGTPGDEVTKQLNEIINNLPGEGYEAMHAHRYPNETVLLLKKTS